MSRAGVFRHVGLVGVAMLLAAGVLAVPGHVPATRAASPGLTITAATTYDVEPEQHRVHVTVDMVMTNHLRDTAATRYFYDRASLAVQPGASGARLSWAGSGTPSVQVTKATTAATTLDLRLAAPLYAGRSATYRLQFDLKDAGGAATRDIRVGSALAAFPVWAFATQATAGSSVRVVFPKGFQVVVDGGSITDPTTDPQGRVVFDTGPLATPLTFFAYLVGDRESEFRERTLTTTVGSTPVSLTIRSWPDDSAWSSRVGDLASRALPALSARIGRPWPRDGGLVIQEAVSRATGGYAGLFDPQGGRIEVAYFADDSVVLHESAHAWFNGSLLADRWANEGFASYYGLLVAKDLKVKATGDALTPVLEKARIPLNDWGALGSQTDATEDYAYAATLSLARAIAERAGEGGLKAVWADAAGRIGAYQPPASTDVATGSPETVADAPDWRGLLDLLEADTPAAYDDLWRTWVARPEDLALLDARQAARGLYAATVTKAGDWQLPKAARDAMRAWRFPEATSLLQDADKVLAARATIEAAAGAAGLDAPDTLQTAFEGTDGMTAALAVADEESHALDAYVAAAAARPPSSDPLQSLGLLGTDPEADLATAASAFEDGDLDASIAATSAATTAWTTAADVGRGRVLSLVVLGLAVALAVGLLVARRRSRRPSGTIAPEGPGA